MSLVKWYYLRCNGCGRLHGNGHMTSQEARRSSRRDGWKREPGSASQGRDYCPPCSRQRGLTK